MSETATPSQQIRTMHPYGYRSGEWANLCGTVPNGNHECYLVEFPDGATDFWEIRDPDGQYEFRDVS